ncbi:uncharacterized protein LOC116407756 [Xenopus tropicalis]|nr:uncharacterized protein LOC116407756 [Xenopus tropicalis]
MTDSMIASTVRQSTSKLEKKNMLIALGHLKDKTHEDRMKEKLQERIGRECNQLLFTKGEIRRYEYLYALYPKTKLDEIRAALSTASPGHEGYISSPTNHTVGIVSRSAESDYKWLGQYLKDSFQIEVRPIYISNSGKLKFWDDVSHCTFAILYHTQKRGRINITDVTNSLYDEEIQHLASALGKDNVIVVADDLDNSSIEERERILQRQPSIGLYARDLILFTKKETDPNYERLVTQQEQEDERSLNEKLETLRNIIGKAKATMMSGAADTADVHGQEEPSNTPPSETNELTEPQRIGIFSRSAESDYQWLLNLLKSEFMAPVHEVRPCNISNIEHKEFLEFQCTFGILYHMNRGRENITYDLYDDLKLMSGVLGKENVVVVADGIEGPTEHNIGEYACDLVLLTQADKGDQGRLREKLGSIIQKIKTAKKRKLRSDGNKEEKKTKFPEPGYRQASMHGFSGITTWIRNILNKNKRLTVGICSRESQETYNWLVTLLKTEDFRKKVTETRPVYVSNTFSQFRSDVSGCTFAILYHSKRRGTVNITDVTDSLYDQELEHLSQSLGRKKVIVVIDDLEDSSDSAKSSIQQSQGSIGRWACDLFLFSARDKESLQSGSRPTDVELKRRSLYSILSQAM